MAAEPTGSRLRDLLNEWDAEVQEHGLWTSGHTIAARIVAVLRASVPSAEPEPPTLEAAEVQLLAWAVTNCHMLARRALAHTMSVYDREKWEHVLRICEKAGARSKGVLRASLPTEITEGSEHPPIYADEHGDWIAANRGTPAVAPVPSAETPDLPPEPPLKHLTDEITSAHVALDKRGAPKTKMVRRRDGIGEQEITLGLAERIEAASASTREQQKDHESRSPDGDGRIGTRNKPQNVAVSGHVAADNSEAGEAAMTSRAGSEPADSLTASTREPGWQPIEDREKSGVELIDVERARQMRVEGWTLEHDDEHDDGSLAAAASCLAAEGTDAEFIWPGYELSWIKVLRDKHATSDRMRQLVIAGALIAAEIDRLRRLPAPPVARAPEPEKQP